MNNIPLNLLFPSAAAHAMAMDGSIQSTETGAAIPDPRPKLENLPEEMLLQIFQAVHDAPIPQFSRTTEPCEKDLARYDQGTRGIQNVRLTCRKFNRISSELLIKFVGVSLSEESLARFQAIMGHPTIGKGVSMVRIRLPIYEERLYNSHRSFAIRVSSSLEWIAKPSRNLEPGVARLAEQYRTTLWSPIGNPNREFLEAVEPGWQEYRRRYRAQCDLRTEQFVEDFAKALLTRTTKRELRLEISDRNDFRRLYERSMQLATTDNLLDVVSKPQPSQWTTANSRSVLPRGWVWMLPLIVKAYSYHRIGILDLHFDISCMKTSQQLVFGQADKNLLREALGKLRSFTFICQNGPFRDEPEDLISVFHGCLSSSTSLRNLRLESVRLRPCQLPNLSQIFLTSVHFDVERLALLLQPLEPRKVDISLAKCKIVRHSRGSWADVFDLLRSKQPRSVCLSDPEGKEFDGPVISNYLPRQVAHWVNRQTSFVSLARQYIRGSQNINPFRNSRYSRLYAQGRPEGPFGVRIETGFIGCGTT